MGAFSELKRRNVLRMAVLYVLATWLVMQVAGVLMDLGGLPAAAGPWLLAVLVIGFPIALVFSWFYELTPEGLALEKDVPRHESITHLTGRRIDFIVIALLCAAVLMFAVDKWWVSPPPDHSIAVLAFENMSGDPGQEYFSDGISEELLNLLAKVPELQVISRSSSFSFKDKDLDIREIGKQLNVAHVLEGSVRKSGNRIRITAQLIEASSDTHVWSETFDRELGDIFAIQDEIARNVVTKLRFTLTSAVPATIATQADVFSMYLQAKHLSRKRNPKDLKKAQLLLEKALEIDPTFAPAWNRLSIVYVDLAENALIPRDRGYALARNADEKAIVADPRFAPSYAGLAWVALSYDGDFATAAQHLQRALEIDAYNTAVISDSAALLKTLGRLEEAILLEELNIRRDPLTPGRYNNLAASYYYAGRLDEAEHYFRKLLQLSPKYSRGHTRLGVVLLAKQDPVSALEVIKHEVNDLSRAYGLTLAYFDNGNSEKSDEAFAQLLKKLPEQYGYIAMAHAHRGEIDSAFEAMELLYARGGSNHELRVDPRWEPLRSDKRWTDLLTRAGLSDEQVQDIQFRIPSYN